MIEGCIGKKGLVRFRISDCDMDFLLGGGGGTYLMEGGIEQGIGKSELKDFLARREDYLNIRLHT